MFLANENIPLASIILLEKYGCDIVSILRDRPGARDRDVLIQAQKKIELF